jgi:hypothetical protein
VELRCQNLPQNLISLETQIQESSQPNVQRQRDALLRFERGPRMENLPPVHAASKEPCILKHKTTLHYITLSE